MQTRVRGGKGTWGGRETEYFVALNVAKQWTIFLLVQICWREGKVLGSGVYRQRTECERENS
jgi:hypothetical protein